MRLRHKIFFVFAFIGLAFNAIKYSPFIAPQHFPKPEYDFQKNPISNEKIILGRALFYDQRLSFDNSTSCASCHSPYNAFAHTDHKLSHGIGDQIGNRNAPALMNLAWHKSFMWDGAINHLDMQALAPITHPKEMGENIENLVKKLQKTKTYPPLFYNAYGDSIITGEHLLKALSQFQLTLVTANSKYDNVMLHKAAFSDQEKNGYAIFKKNCNSCHTEPLFSNYKFANNGLRIDTILNDLGRYNITKLEADCLMFKVPTLRNLTYTYPYMHDGRFKSVAQVINHYVGTITPSKTLAKELRNGINLSSTDKVDLIAFLLCLNDSQFVFNPQHQFPKEILLPPEGIKK